MHDARNTAQAKNLRSAVAQLLNERTADCASVVAEHLAKTGAPQREPRDPEQSGAWTVP